MKLETPRAVPTFFWQGLLILLPVFLLAALGLYSLRQDRLLATQEARQQAAQNLRQISAALREAGPDLAFFGSNPLGARMDPLWTGSKAASAFSEVASSGAGNGLKGREKSERDWLERSLTDRAKGPHLPCFCAFGAAGNLEYPPDYPNVPEPPLWLAELSDPQRAAWTLVRAEEASGSALALIREDYLKFLALMPGPSATANARFGLLLLDLKTNPLETAVTRLLGFAAHYTLYSRQTGRAVPSASPDKAFSEIVLAESGLPLGTIALARALDLAKPTGLTRPMLEVLRQQLRDAPSILFARLLDQAGALVPADPDLRAGVLQLRQAMVFEEELRGLAREVLAHHPLAGTSALFWVGRPGWDRLAILTPPRGTEWSSTNQAASAWLIPKASLEGALDKAFVRSHLEIPNYFSLEVLLEDRRLESFDDFSPGGASFDRAALLAGEKTAVQIPSAQTFSLPAADSSPTPQLSAFSLHPALPSLTIRLYLARPDLLYTAQHRRTLWFVLLITAAAAAAVIGFLTSRRAFLRQRQLGEMKTNFVSSVSHELRAPIASVRLMAEALERGRIAGPQKQNEYFHFIVQECRRLSSLVENLLDFSRIEQSRKEYEFEPTDLSALVLETVKLMEPAAAERQVQIETVSPAEPLAVTADGNALQQALVNLLDNAIKHSPPNSTVSVGLGQTGGAPATAFLWVEDHGPGIPASEHARIFERFYRRGSELRRETRGVGIGLSIVKHIVEAHRGSIMVRSAEGHGSRFTIEIPLDPVPTAPVAAPAPTS